MLENGMMEELKNLSHARNEMVISELAGKKIRVIFDDGRFIISKPMTSERARQRE